MDPNRDRPESPTGTEEQDLDVTSSAATSTAADENPGSSPEGEHEEAGQSLHDMITAAAGGEESDEGDGEELEAESEADKPDDEEADGDKPKAESADQEAEEEDDGSDVEEGQRIPYQRFKKVIDQRNELKQKYQTVEQERDQYRQGHEQHQALQTFMKESSLSNEDVVETLHIASLFSKDPAKAASLLQEKLQMLHRLTGDVLPDDLQDQVEVGEISEARAKEIARLRVENALTQHQYQELSQAQQQRAQAEQVQQVRNSMASAADRVQAEIMKSDPDYERKASWVRKELQLLIAERRPATADDAAALVREAHANVTRELGKLSPRPQVRPGPSSAQGRGASTGGREPTSMAEAIRMAAQQAAE